MSCPAQNIPVQNKSSNKSCFLVPGTHWKDINAFKMRNEPSAQLSCSTSPCHNDAAVCALPGGGLRKVIFEVFWKAEGESAVCHFGTSRWIKIFCRNLVLLFLARVVACTGKSNSLCCMLGNFGSSQPGHSCPLLPSFLTCILICPLLWNFVRAENVLRFLRWYP